MDGNIYDWEALHAGLMQDGSVAGPDMEYSSEFLALNLSSKYQEDRQVGDKVIAGREPDWAEVFQTGTHLLMKTKDLRVLAITAEAAVNRYGIQGLTQSLQLIRDSLVSHWEDVHPQLMIDNEFDPLFRSNAVASLADSSRVLKQFRLASLLSTPIGSITVADAEKLLKGLDFGHAVVRSKAELMQAVEAHREKDSLLASLSSARDFLKEINQQFEKNIDAEFWPDATALMELLESLLQAFPFSEAIIEIHENAADAIQSGEVDANQVVAVKKEEKGLPKYISNATDAFLALGLARGYFEKYEPSHPAPLLIKRIERLQGKDFFEMVQDLTPEGLRQLNVISGVDGSAST